MFELATSLQFDTKSVHGYTPLLYSNRCVLLVLQVLAMRKMLRDPRALAPWYNGTGVTLYVLGMLASAFAVRALLPVAGP